mgnify:CR=1 FL=1
MSRGYAKYEPRESATWYDEWTEKEGGDGEIWHVKADSRGTMRWTRGKAPMWTHELKDQYWRSVESGVPLEGENKSKKNVLWKDMGFNDRVYNDEDGMYVCYSNCKGRPKCSNCRSVNEETGEY